MNPSVKLLTPDNHALVLIDVESQMIFAVESISINALRTNTAIVAGTARIFNIPTIVTTAVEAGFSGPVIPEVEEFFPKASSGYTDRTTMNSWEDKDTYDAIVSKKKKKIVFAGLWTSVCILDAALSAIEEGYEAYAITDACGDVSTEAHERSVQRMIQYGVQPMTAVQYILELQRDWARKETYTPVMDLMKRFGAGYGVGIQYSQVVIKH